MKYLLILSILFFPLMVSAQESQTFVSPAFNYSNSQAKTAQQVFESTLPSANLEQPRQIDVSLTHEEYMELNQFGLKLSVPDIPAGCQEISPLEYEANFIDSNYMDIYVKGFMMTPVYEPPEGGGCPVEQSLPTALIVLDADDLRSRNIRQIRFTDGNARDNYNITYNDKGLSLTPDSMVVFKQSGGNLEYSFDMARMIALQVPMAEIEDNLEEAVRRLAAKHALIPISSETKMGKTIYHFMDDNGRTTGMINQSGYGEIGTVMVSRPFSGQNGLENRAVPLKVFVTRRDVVL